MRLRRSFRTKLFNRSMSTGHFPSMKPLSRRLGSLGSMSQMLSRIVQILIFRWCQSYLSGLLHINSTITYSPLVFCRVFSPTFNQATRQKLLFFAFCLISCRLSTLKMSLLWCRWICPLLLTLSIDHAILCRRLRLSFELDVHGMVLVIPS